MAWIAATLAAAALFFATRYYLVCLELKRLGRQLSELRANARFGRRLYLEESVSPLAKAMSAINQMVDGYEGDLRRTQDMERNMRLSISGISHDLRTPLTSLSGYLQLLKKESDPGKRCEYFETIARSADVLRDLTENFFELSRIELGEMSFSPQILNLEHFVNESFLDFYESFLQLGLNVELGEADCEFKALADPLALNRILGNLMQNLLRYARGTIAAAFSSDNNSVSVTIANESSAPLPPDPALLFERFYTADPSRSAQGSGLGLYVSKKLAEGMGGSLAAHLDCERLAITLRLPKA
jgi:signal transduction histidine kinase